MGRKIFVTYKYADDKVLPLDGDRATVRTYVDTLQEILKNNEYINKGEIDDADLSQFKDDTIQTKLGEKIFDSSLTIIMISKGMADPVMQESDQWIPWEISYSLKKEKRGERTSKPNALLAIVLPDESGDYEYYIINNSCPHCKCRTLKTNTLFKILKENMFNIKSPEYNNCAHHSDGKKVYSGNPSYITSVTWDRFISTPSAFIEKAIEIGNNIDSYNVKKII